MLYKIHNKIVNFLPNKKNLIFNVHQTSMAKCIDSISIPGRLPVRWTSSGRYQGLGYWKPGKLRKYITISVLGQDEGYQVKYSPLGGGVPKGKGRGNSQRWRAIFDSIYQVKSEYRQYLFWLRFRNYFSIVIWVKREELIISNSLP